MERGIEMMGQVHLEDKRQRQLIEGLQILVSPVFSLKNPEEDAPPFGSPSFTHQELPPGDPLAVTLQQTFGSFSQFLVDFRNKWQDFSLSKVMLYFMGWMRNRILAFCLPLFNTLGPFWFCSFTALFTKKEHTCWVLGS